MATYDPNGNPLPAQSSQPWYARTGKGGRGGAPGPIGSPLTMSDILGPIATGENTARAQPRIFSGAQPGAGQPDWMNAWNMRGQSSPPLPPYAQRNDFAGMMLPDLGGYGGMDAQDGGFMRSAAGRMANPAAIPGMASQTNPFAGLQSTLPQGASQYGQYGNTMVYRGPGNRFSDEANMGTLTGGRATALPPSPTAEQAQASSDQYYRNLGLPPGGGYSQGEGQQPKQSLVYGWDGVPRMETLGGYRGPGTPTLVIGRHEEGPHGQYGASLPAAYMTPENIGGGWGGGEATGGGTMNRMGNIFSQLQDETDPKARRALALEAKTLQGMYGPQLSLAGHRMSEQGATARAQMGEDAALTRAMLPYQGQTADQLAQQPWREARMQSLGERNDLAERALGLKQQAIDNQMNRTNVVRYQPKDETGLPAGPEQFFAFNPYTQEMAPIDAGAPAPQGQAPQSAIDHLKAHPELAPAFKAKYGYLPR